MNNFSPLDNENHAIHILDYSFQLQYIGNQSMFKLGKLIEGIKNQLVRDSSRNLSE